ncbi:IS5 family transposase (plasmid) [Streptosporangium sp. CA-135522]|uniref:IS5 family transposase n=1 Tax=Streptosporangium sp. CA-135522 TaxID=3240072 RepID=UPI003D923398
MPRKRAAYATDLSDPEWETLAPLIPPAKPGGRPAVHERREIVNALAYWMRAGCAWRLLPHDLPPWQTVYHYWRLWRIEGRWEQITAVLRERERVRQGRHPLPSAGIVDSQSIKTTGKGGLHGYDGAKKVNGRKRHLLVDTLGIVCKAHVSAANIGDRDGAAVLLAGLGDSFPRLAYGWVDQGYRGPFLQWVKQVTGITLQVVVRRDGGMRSTWAPVGTPPRIVPRFAVVPRRWVVERTFAWLGRYRRLAKDYEYLPATSENTIYLATTFTLLHRLARAPI